MVGFLDGVRAAIQAVDCGLAAGGEFVAGSIGNLPPSLRQRGIEGFQRYRRLRGCDPANDPVEPPPPFTGGQCNDVYLIEFNWNVPGGNPPNQSLAGRVRGPISGVGFFTRPNGTNTIRFNAFSGYVAGALSCGTVPGPNEPTVVTLPNNINVNAQGLSATVTPCGLDNCGDPPPVYPPPINIDIDLDVTYEIDDGTEITVTIPFTFSPFTIDFDGSINRPFTFNFGGFDFSGNLSFNPDVPITINLPGFNPGDGQGTEGLPQDPEAPEVPPAPPDQKIIGVIVTATTISGDRVSAYSSPGIPNIFVPRYGSVKFAYSLGVATFWSSDIDLKDRRTFIPCPFSQGADAVVASPQLGVDLQFLPIRGTGLVTKGDLQRLS